MTYDDRIDWDKGILIAQTETNDIRNWSQKTRTKKMQKARAKAKRARRSKR